MNQTNSTCAFCSIHEPGVYLLNISGIVVLVLVIIVYWKEVSASCCGTGKIIYNPGYPEIPAQVATDQPTAIESIVAQKMANSPAIASTLPPQPVLSSAPVQPPPPHQSSPLGFQQMGKKSTTRFHAPQQLIEQPSSRIDAFKLPKPEPKVSSSKESTGSNYFKQMMRGKHPVLSISQYEVKRLNKLAKKGEKEGAKKHHHHHRKKK